MSNGAIIICLLGGAVAFMMPVWFGLELLPILAGLVISGGAGILAAVIDHGW